MNIKDNSQSFPIRKGALMMKEPLPTRRAAIAALGGAVLALATPRPTFAKEISVEKNGCLYELDSRGTLTISPTGSDAVMMALDTALKGAYGVSNLSEIYSVIVCPGVSAPQDSSFLFYGLSNVEEMDLSGLDTSSATNMTCMFLQSLKYVSTIDLSHFDTSSVTSMAFMFSSCNNIRSLDLSSWDVSSVTDMSGMFANCTSLSSIDVSSWNVANVRDMTGMFSYCEALQSLDLSEWDTSSLESVNRSDYTISSYIHIHEGYAAGSDIYLTGMFEGCKALKTLHLDGWDVTGITSLSRLLVKCSALTDIDLSSWDTSSVRDLSYVFEGCTSLTNINLASWDTSLVTSIGAMFAGCSSLHTLNLSSFTTRRVEGILGMFAGCSSLTILDISGFDSARCSGGAFNSTYGWNGETYSACTTIGKLTVGTNWGGEIPTGYWWSTSDKAWFTNTEIQMDRPYIEDSYIRFVGVDYVAGVQGSSYWQDVVRDGAQAGTTGSSLRLEGFAAAIKTDAGFLGGIEYRSHIQGSGWEKTWRKGSEITGSRPRTSGGKRLEAMQARLYGELADYYDIYCRLHVQRFGWMGWAKNGIEAGSAGYRFRVESVQMVLLPKECDPKQLNSISPASRTTSPFVGSWIKTAANVQKLGWQADTGEGDMAGTQGKSLRIEGLRIGFASSLPSKYRGSHIQYRSHVQGVGWQKWVQDYADSGLPGKGKRLEAIQIKLTGSLATDYDIWYRAQVQNFGWMGWAKNGASAGSSGYGYRIEALQICLMPKNVGAPAGSDTVSISSKRFSIKADYICRHCPIRTSAAFKKR